MTSRLAASSQRTLTTKAGSTMPACQDTFTTCGQRTDRQSKPNHRNTGKGTIYESV